MYELYDKNGNQIGYRMTKRIKNEDSQVYLVKIVYFCPFKRKLY